MKIQPLEVLYFHFTVFALHRQKKKRKKICHWPRGYNHRRYISPLPWEIDFYEETADAEHREYIFQLILCVFADADARASIERRSIRLSACLSLIRTVPHQAHHHVCYAALLLPPSHVPLSLLHSVVKTDKKELKVPYKRPSRKGF